MTPQNPPTGAPLPMARRKTCFPLYFNDLLAERGGFEPPIELPLYRFSRPALSTTQPPLQIVCLQPRYSCRIAPAFLPDRKPAGFGTLRIGRFRTSSQPIARLHGWCKVKAPDCQGSGRTTDISGGAVNRATVIIADRDQRLPVRLLLVRVPSTAVSKTCRSRWAGVTCGQFHNRDLPAIQSMCSPFSIDGKKIDARTIQPCSDPVSLGQIAIMPFHQPLP